MWPMRGGDAVQMGVQSPCEETVGALLSENFLAWGHAYVMHMSEEFVCWRGGAFERWSVAMKASAVPQ